MRELRPQHHYPRRILLQWFPSLPILLASSVNQLRYKSRGQSITCRMEHYSRISTKLQILQEIQQILQVIATYATMSDEELNLRYPILSIDGLSL